MPGACTKLLPNLPSPHARHYLSTGGRKPLRGKVSLGNYSPMGEGRIASAMTRIEAAMERIAKLRPAPHSNSSETGGSAKVSALVNAHEKLREEVADTMRELDGLIEDLEA